MSILTSSYDPLENERLIVGALDNEGRPIAGLEFGTMVVDWYSVVPEAYYKEYLPDNLKNITLEDPVNNTYFLIYITDTYDSIHGDSGAQRIMSLQRWNMIDSSNNYLRMSVYDSTNWVSMGSITTDTNANTYVGGIFSDNGVRHEQSYYPTTITYGGSTASIMWAAVRENGQHFGMANWEQRDKYGDRPGDPLNSPAWVIGKYTGKCNSLLTKYDLRIEWESSRLGRVPTCWKIYQSTNTSTPEWKLLDVHFLDDILYAQGRASKNFEFNCNYGN